MKMKRWTFLCMVALMALSFLATSYAADPEFTLKMQSSYSTGSKTWPCTLAFADKLEELSGGRIKVECFPSAQLVPTTEALTALRRGVIDLLFFAGSYYAGFVPPADVFFIPAAYKGKDDVYSLYNSHEFGKIFKDAYLKFGVVHVAPIYEVEEILMMRKGKDLKRLADVKGLLIRGPGGTANNLVKMLGGKAVQLPTGELYTAMQRGTVDGVIYPTYLLEDLNMYDVTESVVLDPPFLLLVTDIAMSKKTYDKLPKDLQECVQNAGLYTQKRGAEIFAEADARVKEGIKNRGIKTYSWPEDDVKEFRQKSLELIDEWAKNSPDNAALAKILKERIKSN